MNVLSLIRPFLDILLPRRERAVRAETYTLADLAVAPHAHDACGTRITTLMAYKTRAVEDCIRALKYDASASAAALFAEALADYLEEEIAQKKMFSAKRILLVPVPLHGARKNERGFNQIELVLTKLPEKFKNGKCALLAPHTLTRIRNTPPQTRLSRRMRLTNISGAFAATRDVVNVHIFLIDDVTTTGATLAEAVKTLEKAGASVSSIALARA